MYQVPVGVQLLCLLPSSWRVTTLARTKHWPKQPVLRAIRKHSIEPFKHQHRHWAAVLILQRLLTVVSLGFDASINHMYSRRNLQACNSLAPTELQAELGVSIISVWFLLLQALVRPYRVQWVNHLQLLAGWCLVMLSILNAASSSAFVSLGVNTVGSPFEGLREAAGWMSFLLLWPPVIMLLLYTTYEISTGKFVLALVALLGALVGSLIGTLSVHAAPFQKRLLGAALGALAGAVVGVVVGSRPWCMRYFEHCQKYLLGKPGVVGSGGLANSDRETHGSGQLVINSIVSTLDGAERAATEDMQLLVARLLQEKEQEKQRHAQEKDQLLQEKEQEREEREQEKQRHNQDKVELILRLEGLQEQWTKEQPRQPRSDKKDLYSTFHPGEGDKGAA
jgi:hypothetical protein